MKQLLDRENSAGRGGAAQFQPSAGAARRGNARTGSYIPHARAPATRTGAVVIRLFRRGENNAATPQ